MSDSTRLTDEQITSLLRERSAAPMPGDFTAVVLERVRAERALGRRAIRLSPRRSAALLVAAALVVAGLAAVAGFAGAPRPTPRPIATAPAIVVASPSATPTSASSLGTPDCTALDRVAQAGGVGSGQAPIPGPAPAQVTSGSVIISNGGMPSLLDPFAASPSLLPIAAWNLPASGSGPSWRPSPVVSVDTWAAASDGSVVAAEMSSYYSIGDRGGSCPLDVFVLRTDGTGLRRPFAAPGQQAFSPAWSPDGHYLAAATGPWTVATSIDGSAPATREFRSNLVLWSPVSGDLRDLGRPCPSCSPGLWVHMASSYVHMVFWSPDATRIAVNYTDVGCALGQPSIGGIPVPCGGVAIVSLDGTWTFPGGDPALTGGAFVTQWVDDSTILVQDGVSDKLFDVATGSMTDLTGAIVPPSGSLPHTMWSPGAQKVLEYTGDTALPRSLDYAVVDLPTGTTVALAGVPRHLLDDAWSPDGKWILIYAVDVDETDPNAGNINQGLYLVPADGSAPAREILPIQESAGTIAFAWLPGGP